MSVNRKAVVIYGSTDLWIYQDTVHKLRLYYRDISHNLCAKRVDRYIIIILRRIGITLEGGVFHVIRCCRLSKQVNAILWDPYWTVKTSSYK